MFTSDTGLFSAISPCCSDASDSDNSEESGLFQPKIGLDSEKKHAHLVKNAGTAKAHAVACTSDQCTPAKTSSITISQSASCYNKASKRSIMLMEQPSQLSTKKPSVNTPTLSNPKARHTTPSLLSDSNLQCKSKPLLCTDNSTFDSCNVGATDSETMLNNYVKLHPMCGVEVLRADIIKEICDTVKRKPVQVSSLPVVGKSYEDAYLRPPLPQSGERECICKSNCLCMFIAQLRYGKDTNRAFVAAEFLLPEQRRKWLDGHGLPAQQGKCLLCIRYWTTRMYIVARSDPTFQNSVNDQFIMQTHCNIVESENLGRNTYQSCQNVPTHVNKVNCKDGYSQQAMLFVDEYTMKIQTCRSGNATVLGWRPVVRFDSSHYRYVEDKTASGAKPKFYIVQVGVCRHLNDWLPSAESPQAAAHSTARHP